MLKDLKGLLKHSSVYSLGTLLSRIVSFIMLPVYTRCLTPSDYGIIEMLTLTTSVVTLLVSFRLTSALPRFYFGYPDQKKKDSLVSTMMIFSLIISCLVAAGLFEGRFAVSRLVFKTDDKGVYFGYVFASIIFEICTQIGFTYLRVRQRSFLFVGASLLQLILGLGLNILFLVYLKMGVMGILYSIILSNGIVFLAVQVYAFADVGFAFDRAQLKQLLVFSLPLVPAALGNFVLNMGDRFLLARYVTTADIGTYSLGYKFGILLGVFVGTPFLQAWEPKRAELYEKDPGARAIFEKVFLYILFAMVGGALILCAFINEIVALLATPEYVRACLVTPFVAVGYIFYILYYTVDLGLFLKKKTFWYSIISAIAAAVNVGVNLILIPRIGMLGAAIATTISFMVLPVLAYFVSQRYYPVRYEFGKAARILGAGAVLFFASRYVHTGHMPFDIVLKSLLLALFPISLTLTGVFEKAELDMARGILRNGISRATGLVRARRDLT